MNESNFKRHFIEKPIYEIGRGIEVIGRQLPAMTFLNDALIPGSNNYVEFSWIYEVPNPNPLIGAHAHDTEQIVLHIGSDPKNPEALGAEVELVIDGESYVTDRTHLFYLPKKMKHGPITWRRVDRPLIEMTIALGASTAEAVNPGGLA